MSAEIHLADDKAWQARMAAMRHDDRFCDVTFVIGERTFPAHRAVLAMHAGLWSMIFGSEDEKRAREAQVPVSHDPEAFEKLLDYCYTGRLDLSLEVLLKVHVLAHQYEMDTLQRLCETHMAGNVTDASCVEYFCHAGRYSLPGLSELGQAAHAHLTAQFATVSQTPRFKRSLSVEQLCTLLEDAKVAATEDQLLQAAVGWLAHEEERKPLSSRVLWHVRRALLQPQTLLDLPTICARVVDVLADGRLAAAYNEALRVQLSRAHHLDFKGSPSLADVAAAVAQDAGDSKHAADVEYLLMHPIQDGWYRVAAMAA